MKKQLLLSAALLLVASTSLFAQFASTPLVFGDFDGTVTHSITIAATGKGIVDVQYTSDTPKAIFVALVDKANGNAWLNQELRPVDAGTNVFHRFNFTIGADLTDTDPDAATVYHFLVIVLPEGATDTSGVDWGVSENKLYPRTDVVNANLSVSDLELEGFAIYKNPVDSVLELNLPAAGTVEVISLSGKVLVSEAKSAGLATVNVDALSSGIYLCRYSNASGSKTLKLVKN